MTRPIDNILSAMNLAVRSKRLSISINKALSFAILVGLGFFSFLVSPAWAQTSPPAIPDSTLQALFMYNFAKFVEWPDGVFANKQSPIVLCIYGEKPSDIRQSIGAINGKMAQGREVLVWPSVTLSDLSLCQMVFVPDSERRWLSEVLRVTQAAGALTVSDMEEFVDAGGVIGLLMVDRQIRFECNLDAAQAAGLKLSAQLLKLARSIKRQGVRE